MTSFGFWRSMLMLRVRERKEPKWSKVLTQNSNQDIWPSTFFWAAPGQNSEKDTP